MGGYVDECVGTLSCQDFSESISVYMYVCYIYWKEGNFMDLMNECFLKTKRDDANISAHVNVLPCITVLRGE